MDMNKTKKRGRPAQLLQVSELHAFVEFLLAKNARTELQNQVIAALQRTGFIFAMLAEAEQVLVKEALKPYREHTKLRLLAEQLKLEKKHSDYEAKFLVLYSDYEKGCLDSAALNILKTMCTRYLKFKAQKLELRDLELYLSQIQKSDASKKRKAENNRKFGLGGAVISAYKELGIDLDQLSLGEVKSKIVQDHKKVNEIKSSVIYQQIDSEIQMTGYEWRIFFKVIDALTDCNDEDGIPEYLRSIYSVFSELEKVK